MSTQQKKPAPAEKDTSNKAKKERILKNQPEKTQGKSDGSKRVVKIYGGIMTSTAVAKGSGDGDVQRRTREKFYEEQRQKMLQELKAERENELQDKNGKGGRRKR